MEPERASPPSCSASRLALNEVVVLSAMRCVLRPWLGSFKRKLSQKDKDRIERLAKDKGQAMVRKKVDARGRVRVYYGCIP